MTERLRRARHHYSHAALLVSFLLLTSLAAHAQPAGSFESWAQSFVQEWQARIDSWNSSGRIVLMLTLGVGTLGIAVAALQAAKRRPWKVIAATLGVAISVCTLVKTQVYEVEHRSYFNAADEAEQRVATMRRWISGPYANDEERSEAIAQVRKLVVELENIDRRLHGKADPSGSKPAAAAAATGSSRWVPGLGLGVLEPVAFAQSQSTKPGWLQGRAPDADTVYFVGTGVDTALAAAKAESFDNAIASARDSLTAQIPIGKGYDATQLASYLAEAGSVIDSYFERGATGYRYSTLIGIAKQRMAVDARLFGFRERVAVPTATVQAAQAVKAPSAAYQGRRQETYEQITRQAQKEVNPEAYRLYQAGRSLRLRGEPGQAAASLTEAVRITPAFFMAWYNLGLALEAGGNTQQAEQAYARARDLEPAQPVRDPSVYNTSGWLFYQQGRFKESEAMFQKALQIDPAHQVAKRNLAAAQAQLRGK